MPLQANAITSTLRDGTRRQSLTALGEAPPSVGTAAPSASVAPELKRLDWLDLHYAHIPPSIGLRSSALRRSRESQASQASQASRASLHALSGLADGYLPTSAEGVASAATLASAFMASPYSGIGAGLAGAALLANGGPGAAKFAQSPSRNRADAFSFANVASGLLTMYGAIPIPQWGGMHFLTSALTAVGAMPNLCRMRTARSGAVRALNGLSAMGYVLNSAFAIEAARSLEAGDQNSSAYTHASNAAWMGAWLLSNLAGHIESRNGAREDLPVPGDALRLLGPGNV